MKAFFITGITVIFFACAYMLGTYEDFVPLVKKALTGALPIVLFCIAIQIVAVAGAFLLGLKIGHRRGKQESES